MSSINLFSRAAMVTMTLLIVSGCSPKNVLDRQVKAGSTTELAGSRERLAAEVSPQLLQDFDTAIQELKLDAINKGVAGAALREEQVRALANGKPVREVLVLGWQARHSRLMSELKEISERYAHDSKLLARPGSEDSTQFLSNVTRNETDVMTRLKSNLADTDQKLSGWGVNPSQLVRSN